jgi:hypothetical protein
MSIHLGHGRAASPTISPLRRSFSFLAAVGLLAGLLTIGAGSVSAAVVCQDCQNPSITTPLGTATVVVSAANVVTVDFAATDPSHTFVAALPFAVPPGPPCRLTGGAVSIPPGPPCFVRNSLVTSGGTVNIDTVSIPPGPQGFAFTFTSLAIISIHPPSPCRMTVTRTATDTLVVFTPRI